MRPLLPPPLLLLPLLLLLPALISVATGADSGGFWNARFDTNEFARLHYNNVHTITIFQHVTKNTTFYFTPLALLLHRSGDVAHSPLTGFYELRLRVLMWDSDLSAAVEHHLRSKWGVQHPVVKLLPMEKVRFAWRSRHRRIKASLLLESEFMSTNHLPQELTLTFGCRDRSECELLNAGVREYPEILDRLVVECFMTTKRSAVKTVTISSENLMKSKTFAKLSNLPADGNFQYMRADDFNKLTQEILSSVKVTTLRSTEYVDRPDEVKMVALIESALKHDAVQIDRLSESQWSSVFWSPAYARPDRVVKEASRTFVKDADSKRLRLNRRHLRASEDASKLFDRSSSGGSGWRSSSSSHGGSESAVKAYDSGSFSKDDVNSVMKQRGLNVEWTGERFVVKPLRLVRVNRRGFESRRRLVSESMQLTLYQQTMALKVRILRSGNFSADALLQDRKEEEEDRSSAASRFPTSHSYCLLSNAGHCPRGFNASAGSIGGIHFDSDSAGNRRSAGLGDSAIVGRRRLVDDVGVRRLAERSTIALRACCR